MNVAFRPGLGCRAPDALQKSLVSTIAALLVCVSLGHAGPESEASAGRTPEPDRATAARPTSGAPRTVEQLAIRDLQNSARARMRDLVAAMTGLPDGPARDAFELKIVELKKQHRIEVLKLKAGFARQRGDLAAAAEAERAAEQLLNPPKPAPGTVAREIPRSAASEGGRK